MKINKYIFISAISILLCLFVSSCFNRTYYCDITGFELPPGGIVVNTEATITLALSEYRPIDMQRSFIWKIDDNPNTITTVSESLTTTFTTPGLHRIFVKVEFEGTDIEDFLHIVIDVRPAP